MAVLHSRRNKWTPVFLICVDIVFLLTSSRGFVSTQLTINWLINLKYHNVTHSCFKHFTVHDVKKIIYRKLFHFMYEETELNWSIKDTANLWYWDYLLSAHTDDGFVASQARQAALAIICTINLRSMDMIVRRFLPRAYHWTSRYRVFDDAEIIIAGPI
jgi:hypothetical protein